MFTVNPVMINGKKLYEVRVEVRDRAGKKRAKKRRYSSEREAKTEGLKLLNELQGSKDNFTWKEWSDACLEKLSVEFKNSTTINYQSVLSKWINPHWENWPLDKITPTDVHELVFKKANGISFHTRKEILKKIKRFLGLAVQEGLLKMNPAQSIRVKIPEVHQKVLSASEIQILLKEAKTVGHRFYDVWALAILTGMRSGELHALKWSALDLESGFIHVTESWTNKNGLGPTKSARNRVVPISSECSRFLKELRMRTGSTGFVLSRLSEWDSGDQARVLREFCAGIGITQVKFHDLRATFITQMLRNGVALAKVMAIVGHSELKTTQGYLRLCGQDVVGATEGLGVTLPEENVAQVYSISKG